MPIDRPIWVSFNHSLETLVGDEYLDKQGNRVPVGIPLPAMMEMEYALKVVTALTKEKRTLSYYNLRRNSFRVVQVGIKCFVHADEGHPEKQGMYLEWTRQHPTTETSPAQINAMAANLLVDLSNRDYVAALTWFYLYVRFN
jgi:hypothetical protein